MLPIRFLSRPLALGAALLMAACTQEATSPDEAGESAAAAEVLDGTISDDMLPLGQVRSEAPRAAVEPGEAGGTSGPASGASGAASAAPSAENATPQTDAVAEESAAPEAETAPAE